MNYSVDQMLSKLYVVTVVSNPVSYSSRFNLYKKFEQHMKNLGAQLITVEIAFGDRPHVVTTPNNIWNLQLRSLEELWHKENMYSLGIKHLTQNIDPNWLYVATVDADVYFHNENILVDTVNQLQHYHVCQMFQNAIDLGPNGEALNLHNGFMYSYVSGMPYAHKSYSYWHPGFAHAYTRHAIDSMGSFHEISRAILGAADHHICMSLIGRGAESVPAGLHPNYMHMVMAFQDRCERFIKRDVNYVKGLLIHGWHGPKRSRGYWSRWGIAKIPGHEFDPYTDIFQDAQGLWQLDHDKIVLRDAIRAYFRSRNEDSIDL